MSAEDDESSGGVLDAEAMRGVNHQMLNAVRENPALFLEPRYAPLREFVQLARDNPEQFPLSGPTNDSQGDDDDDEEEDGDKKIAAGTTSDTAHQQQPSTIQKYECLCADQHLAARPCDFTHQEYCADANTMFQEIQIMRTAPPPKPSFFGSAPPPRLLIPSIHWQPNVIIME